MLLPLIITIILIIWLIYTEKIKPRLLLSSLGVFLLANAVEIYVLLNKNITESASLIFNLLMIFLLWVLVLIFIAIQIFPCKTEAETPLTTKILYGGKALINIFWLNFFTQIALLIFQKDYFSFFSFNTIPWFIVLGITLLNAWWRIFIFSKRLRLWRRVIVAIFIFVPIIQFVVLIYMQHIAEIEYDHACNKIELEDIRKDLDICETKYPLLLLHGIGFRDLKFFNYWGRIPKNLKKNGATIYYGHQEAFGTIENNGMMIKRKILEILEQEGCQKVNIIAHSKGGLDARYAISTLGMGEHVATLTTFSTPHRGSYLADLAIKWAPKPIYFFLAKQFNKWFAKIGDQNPDFYLSTHQLTSVYLVEFNKNNLDDERVYYQSYASVMKNMFSHGLLSVPYFLMTIRTKDTDGLVQLESAKWGTFKEVFRNNRIRGISHGDIIDLTREDYKNFNIIETYIKVIAELKAMGY